MLRFIFFALCFQLPLAFFAQNASDSTLTNCELIVDSFYTLKTFEVDHFIGNEKGEYSYVFCKDNDYHISLCENGGSSVIHMELFDSDKKLITSNYDKKSDTYLSTIAHSCTETGVYYITFKSRKEWNPACIVGEIGFKKNKID